MSTKTNTPEKGKGEASPVSTEPVLTAVVQTIEQKIEYYQKKQELIQRFHALEDTNNVLSDHLEGLGKETGEDIFMSDQYKLTLTVKSGYSSEREILKFRNPEILAELLAFIQGKIAGKMDQVGREIAA